jgi:hypothetical protein
VTTIARTILPVLVLLIVVFTVVAGSAFAAEAPFIPIDLGTLGGVSNFAYAVNDSG